MMADVVVERTTIVRGGAGKGKKGNKWHIHSSETLNGIEFVDIQKADQGFVRFVTGVKGGLRDFDWLDDLRRARNTAIWEATMGAEPSMFEVGSCR